MARRDGTAGGPDGSAADPGDPAPADRPEIARSRLVRGIWIFGGLLLVGIGAVGVVVPGLPSTIFFILAAAAFSRSSTRLERWLLSLPGIGRMVRDYREGLGMRRRAKIAACAMIVVAVGISTGLLIGAWTPRAVVLAAGAVGVAYITWWVPTRETLQRLSAEHAG